MIQYRMAFFCVLAALALSIGLHIVRRQREPAKATAAAAAAAVEPPTDDGPKLEQCRSELERCRQAGWRMVQDTFQRDVEQRRWSSDRVASPTGEAPRETDFESQRQALCDVGIAFLRQAWTNAGDQITELMSQAGSEAWFGQLRDYRLDALRRQGAREADIEQMAAGYEEIFRRRRENLREAVTADPMDYEALLTQAQEIFAEEDRLVGSVLGDEARQRLRGSDLHLRTAYLAGLAHLAHIPYDESLAW